MSLPSVSVVVVSRGRPHLLRRALLSLWQQDHPELEVVVVADAPGLAAAGRLPFAERLKTQAFEAANISAARNAGIRLAAGEVVAFLDDDAAAEPTWARYLAIAFEAPEVDAATGYVRGRNGISFQWRASSVDGGGAETPLLAAEEGALFRGRPGRAIKTQGTNCAFRLSALFEMGGFDTRFRYFLDETDLDLRLASHSRVTAVLPRAQVHHGFAASATRRADRSPTDLTEIGASVAVFLAAHCLPERAEAALHRFREDQRRRALRHMVAGHIEPRDVGRLLAGFEAGLDEGRARRGGATLRPTVAPDFRPLRPEGPPERHVPLPRRPWQAIEGRAAAAAAVAEGAVATLYLLAPGVRRHRVRFVEPGHWEQTGGLWGRADRERSPPGGWASFRRRAALEVERTVDFRTPGRIASRRVAAVQHV